MRAVERKYTRGDIFDLLKYIGQLEHQFMLESACSLCGGTSDFRMSKSSSYR
jgi:hypothetical protein